MRHVAVPVLLALAPAALAVPTELSHQGRLTDATGVPLDGDHDLSFALWDSPSGGDPAWTEDLADVSFEDGYYAVVLGLTSPLDATVLDGDALWLSIAVDDGPPLAPRQPLQAVPYAIRASSVSGPVDATEIRVGGAVVVQADGTVPWERLGGIPTGLSDGTDDDTLATLTCAAGQLPVFDGSAWACGEAARADQLCDVGRVVVGIDASGAAICEDDGLAVDCGAGEHPVSDGAGGFTCAVDAVATADDAITAVTGSFAASDQACPDGQVMTGVDAGGDAVCVADDISTADDAIAAVTGSFAASDQACPDGQVMTGVDAGGAPTCRASVLPGGIAATLFDEVVVTARRDCAGHDSIPQMRLYLDGVGFDTVPVNETEMTPYTFSFPRTMQASRISVEYTNNGISDGCDRNLYVQGITLSNGLSVASTDTTRVVYDRGDAGGSAFDGDDVMPGREGMSWDGALHFYLTSF